MLNTLMEIGKQFNEEKILWGVGASLVLNFYGLIDDPHDIDLIISIKDVEKADKILRGLGTKVSGEYDKSYSTRYFYEYKINDIDIDFMAGFIINHECGSYEYKFDEKSITLKKYLKNIEIPLTSLEDWYIIYQLLKNRQTKVELIENYLLKYGIKYKFLLERVLVQNLPHHVKLKIKNLMRYTK